MKKAVCLLILNNILFSFAYAGVGGVGGGKLPAIHKEGDLISVQQCNTGESSVECKWTRYRYRLPSPASNKPAECIMQVGEENYQPCPTQFGTFLQRVTESLDHKEN